MDTPPTGPSGPFQLASQRLGPLPVINHFLARLGLPRLLEEYLPAEDRRLKLAPAAAIGVVVRNLVLHREPVTRSPTGRRRSTQSSWGWLLSRCGCSTTTGWAGCWPGSSTPTGPRC